VWRTILIEIFMVTCHAGTPLPDGRQLPAYSSEVARLHKRRSAKIDIADVAKNADGRKHRRAKQTNNHDL
jgi:hypothetical protein